jgi:hypothetical protein
MTAALLALLLSQPLNLNAQPIKSLACDGGLVCSVSGSRATIINTASGGGGGPSGPAAPVDGGYVVWTSVGSTNERVLTAGASISLDTSTPGQIIVNATGAPGSANFAEVDIAFGAGGELVTVVVTGQAWVTASARIICSPTMLATSTRLEAEEDAVVEGLTLAVHSRVAGVGFSITAAPKQGYAYGTFKIHCTGG